MKRLIASFVLLIVSLTSFVSLAGAAGPVYLRDYDPADYQAKIDYYASSPYFTLEEAIAAADRITVEGVTLEATPVPTPTPTATPVPTPTPFSSTGTLYLKEYDVDLWLQVVGGYVAAGITRAQAEEWANLITVSP